MSQVLIGIIGVILFIGLALAGALYLGDSFSNSSHTTKASAGIQTVTQVANAAALYDIQTSNAPSAMQDLVDDGYLLSVPDGMSGGPAPEFFPSSGAPTMVRLRLTHPLEERTSICEAVNKQTSGSATIPTSTNGTRGCYDYVGDGASLAIYAEI